VAKGWSRYSGGSMPVRSDETRAKARASEAMVGCGSMMCSKLRGATRIHALKGETGAKVQGWRVDSCACTLTHAIVMAHADVCM